MVKGLLSDTLAMLADELAAMPGTSMIGSSVSVPVPKGAEMVKAMREAAAALSAGAEPVEYQFQDADGRWCGFHSDKHRDDTIADGRWPIRALYTRPQPATPASGEVRLFDSQWVNIVNHDNCWHRYEIADAVAQAVRMTEAAIAKNVADGKLPQPRPPASTETDKQTAAEQAALERA